MPVYLYDIFYPLKLKKDNEVVDTQSVKNVFKSSRNVLVVGDAGSGKSTLVKHLFINSISEKIGIPVIVELRYLNTYGGGIEQYIKEILFEDELGENDEILQRLLKKGKFIFFLDGFDELLFERVSDIINELRRFVYLYSNNRFLITTRPYSDISMLPSFHNYQVKGMSNSDIRKFVRLQLKDDLEIANKIIDSSIGGHKEIKNIKSFLANPLLLSLYILTFQKNPSVPDRKYIFYRRVIQALFSEHDSKSKFGFNRQRLSGLSEEQYEEVLKRFSFLSFFEGYYSFDLDFVNTKFRIIKAKLEGISFVNRELIRDLKLAVALWVEDGGQYSFAHRSLQEYYASLFIKELNENQKSKVYSALQDDKKAIVQNEVQNFVSLCEEMDRVYYVKYFENPILHNILKRLDKYSYGKREYLKEAILVFYNRMAVELLEDGASAFELQKNENLINKLFFVPNFDKLLNDLYDAMFEAFHTSKVYNTFCEYAKYDSISTGEAFVYSFEEEGVPDELLKLLKKDDKIEISSLRIWSALETRYSNNDKFVSTNIESNDDFVNML